MLAMTETPKTAGQLAFEALEYVSLKPGSPASIARQLADGAVSVEEAAKAFGVHRTAVSDARRLLAKGTPEEIAAVKAGTMTLYAALLGREHRERSVIDRGKNPERLEAQRFELHVWKEFRTAIEALAALPAQSDVARIARRSKAMTAIVDDNFTKALRWMEEFRNVWPAKEATQDRDHHANAADGDEAVGK